MDYSLPGFSVHGILLARILEWLPFPSPGDLPDPGIKPGSPTFQADALTSEPPGKHHSLVKRDLVNGSQGASLFSEFQEAEITF